MFEANQGQTDERVRFACQSNGYRFLLTDEEAIWMLQPRATRETESPASRGAEGAVLRMSLAGANPTPRLAGDDPFPAKVNYLLGPNPKTWRTGIPTFGKVRCERVYPGIDLVYYGRQREMECDFIVAPGVDPAVIRMKFSGAEKIEVDLAHGDLVLHTAAGPVRWHAPVLYQEIEGARRPVHGKYVRQGASEIGFAVAAYDQRRPLVIDPVFVYSTLVGSGSGPQGMGIAVDGAGQAYLAGETIASAFPTTAGAFQRQFRGGGTDRYGGNDAYVTKLNAAGTGVVYSTYLGGTGDDWALAIALDSAGCAYVTGQTKSTDFPTTPGAAQRTNRGGWDTFVTKLNASGTGLLYSTCLGGARDDLGFGIAVDGAGQAHLTGWTLSTDFPATPRAFRSSSAGSYDVFVTKMSAAGLPLYSTYLGGSLGDKGYGIALDPAGNAYVCGLTRSLDFPTTPGVLQPLRSGKESYSDAFVTKLDAAGFPIYSTFLGGAKDDAANGIAVNPAGQAHLAGLAASTDFPTTPGAFQKFRGKNDAFAARLSANGSSLVYSTYLGGSSNEVAHGIALDSSGAAYITGFTYSANFPSVGASFQAKFGGLVDCFVVKLTPAGSPVNGGYSTFLGGSEFDQGEAIAVDSAGRAYVAGVTASANFPTTPGAFQKNYQGTAQNPFVAKIAP